MSTEANAAPSLFQLLRGLRNRRATGTLELDVSGQKRRLHLRDGELFLPGAHPLARSLAERIEAVARRRGGAVSGDATLLELVERIANLLADWSAVESRFFEGVATLPPDLVGPLPTARLLLVSATINADEAEIERRVVEFGPRFVASTRAHALADGLGYLPEEQLLLERLRHSMDLPALLEQCPIPRSAVARHLVQLVALGAVKRDSPGTDRIDRDEGEVVLRIGERIARDLQERPLAIDADEYRRRIGDLHARHGGLDHYEMLGVVVGASVDQIQASYEEVARLVHPSNGARLGLAGREEALRTLFERVTRAYETLMDPERRRAYNERQLIDMPATGPTGERRDAEKREMARAQHERSLVYANAGDFHNAISLLEQAVKTDPRAEYWCALARMQSRNPSWTRRALDSYREGLQLDPQNPEIRFAIGQLYEQLGEFERARVQYHATVRANPNHREAAERLAKINEAREQTNRPGGLLSRFFRRE